INKILINCSLTILKLIFSSYCLQHKDDPLFVEFMESHAKGQKSIWSNDALLKTDSKEADAEARSSASDNEDGDSGHESEGISGTENEVSEHSVAKKKISDLETSAFTTRLLRADLLESVLLLDDRGTVLIQPVAGRAKSPDVERRSDCIDEKEEWGQPTVMAGPSSSRGLTSEQIIQFLDEPTDENVQICDSGSELESDDDIGDNIASDNESVSSDSDTEANDAENAAIVMDFEMANIKATKEEFPNACIKGRLFHFTQSIYRKIIDLGLREMEDTLHRQQMQELLALAFIPLQDIQATFNIPYEDNHEDLLELANFMEHVYMPKFSNEEYCDLILIYGESRGNSREARRLCSKSEWIGWKTNQSLDHNEVLQQAGFGEENGANTKHMKIQWQ
ncbi:hypothetical protein C0J52_14039, partial [Blattella germanica]